MRGFLIAFSFFVAAAALMTGADTASAWDDCGCGPVRGGSFRDCRHPSTRIVVPRGRGGCGTGYGHGYRYGRRGIRGGSWRELRRGLGQGSFYDPTRRWVRDHYLRRFPFAHVVGEEAARMQVLLSEDLLAVLGEEQGKEVTLDAATQLDRAAARFFGADYDGARTDLKAVLAAQPKEPRARWGLFLCAICKNEWENAGKELKALAKAGEIQPGDRLDGDACFGDPKVFPSVVQGLRTYADLRVTDGDAHLLAAWSLASQGEKDLARRYLRMARQWSADATTVSALEKALKGEAARADAEAKPEPKKPGKKDVAPKTNEADATFRAPREPGLHRQIAKAKKAKPRIAEATGK